MSTVIQKPSSGGGSNVSRTFTNFNVNVPTSETNLIHITGSGEIFIIENCFIETDALSTGQTITIKFYNKVNAILKEVAQFVFDEFNYSDPQSLEDMVGQSLFAGTELKITAQSSTSTFAVKGSATYSTTI